MFALLNWEVNALGPLCTLQVPVPTVGLFAARVMDGGTEMQTVWGVPAFEVVGGAFTVILKVQALVQPLTSVTVYVTALVVPAAAE